MPTHTKNRLWITVKEKKQTNSSLLNLLTQLTKFQHQKRFNLAESSETAEILNQEAIIYNEMLTHP